MPLKNLLRPAFALSPQRDHQTSLTHKRYFQSIIANPIKSLARFSPLKLVKSSPFRMLVKAARQNPRPAFAGFQVGDLVSYANNLAPRWDYGFASALGVKGTRFSGPLGEGRKK